MSKESLRGDAMSATEEAYLKLGPFVSRARYSSAGRHDDFFDALEIRR